MGTIATKYYRTVVWSPPSNVINPPCDLRAEHFACTAGECVRPPAEKRRERIVRDNAAATKRKSRRGVARRD